MILILLACTGADQDDDSAAPEDTGSGPVACDGVTETGTLTLTFAMEADYIPSMDEEPVGTVLGSVFDAADADTIISGGDAPAFTSFSLPDVDLAGGGPSTGSVTTDAVPACTVLVLGCLDSDANDCDEGDPVTVPGDNTVTVHAGADTAFTMFFGLLNPG